MTSATQTEAERERAAVLRVSGLTWPARRPQREAGGHARKPLFTAPIVEEEPERREEEPAPEMSAARAAELIAHRKASAEGNRPAHLSDIDILCERGVGLAVWRERQARRQAFETLAEAAGQIIAEEGRALRDELLGKLDAMEAALAERDAKVADMAERLARIEGRLGLCSAARPLAATVPPACSDLGDEKAAHGAPEAVLRAQDPFQKGRRGFVGARIADRPERDHNCLENVDHLSR
jgi:hypothetical protein